MDDDLVLLTSYFNLTNGRRQDSADTFRVEPSVPSRTSQDGNAALYIITESSASGHMGPRARRLTADTIAWEYASHADEPPAPRLRSALRTAHDEVLREFDGHVSVGVSVIAVEHDDVYLAQVPPAQVYVLHEGSLHSMPATAAGTSPFARALGSSAGPQISVYRDKIAIDDVLALCSAWFNRTADAESLRECFGAGSADEIAACLLELGKDHGVRDATVIVIEAVRSSELTEGEGSAQTFMEQVDMAVQALAGVGRMLMSELRPPATDRSRNGRNLGEDAEEWELAGVATAAGEPHSRQGRHAPPEELTHEIPAVAPDSEPAGAEPWNPDETAVWESGLMAGDEAAPSTEYSRNSGRFEPPEAEETAEAEAVVIPETAPYDEPPPARERRGERDRQPESELDAVNLRLQHAPDMADVIPPVQAFPDTSTEPERIYATSRDIRAVNKRPRRFGGIARPPPDEGAPVIRPGLSDIDLRRPMPHSTPPAVMWGGGALLAVLVLVAAVLYLRHRHSTPPVAADPYPAQALALIGRAQAAKQPRQQDALLAAARRDIRLAGQNGATPARIRGLRNRYRQASDVIYRITRVSAPVIVYSWAKTPNAQPSELATSATTLFVLDPGSKAVYSLAQGTNSSTSQIVQSGEQDSGISIGSPTQLATAGSIALVLDNNNNLVRDDSGTKSAILLQAPSPAQKIVAMANFGQSVYTLDAAGAQIWQYQNAVSGTGSSATPLLSTSVSSLSNAVSFALDDRDVYVLESNGAVLKFDETSGAAQPYTLASRSIRTALPHVQKPVSVFTDAGLSYVWVADPVNHRILQFDKSGNYVREYVSGTASLDLSQIKSLVVPPSGKFLYVVSGKVLYQFPVVP